MTVYIVAYLNNLNKVIKQMIIASSLRAERSNLKIAPDITSSVLADLLVITEKESVSLVHCGTFVITLCRIKNARININNK